MRSVKSSTRAIVLAIGIVPAMIGASGIFSAQSPAAEKAEPKKEAPKEKNEGGRFVSFKDGTLTLKTHTGTTIEKQIAENTKASVWSHEEGVYQPKGAAEALKLIKPGTVVGVQTAKDSVTLRIGAKKGQTVGTFVSFKDDRLTILGKDFPESFTKKYGNTVHFQNCTTQSGTAAGIWTKGSANLTLQNGTTFTNLRSTGEGTGGCINHGTGNLTITGGAFSGCVVDNGSVIPGGGNGQGGAIYIAGVGSNSLATISGVAFTGNIAGQSGGAIYLTRFAQSNTH